MECPLIEPDLSATFQKVIRGALRYVSTLESEGNYRLFSGSDVSPYARCFVIYVRSLCRDSKWLDENRTALIEDVNKDFLEFYNARISGGNCSSFDKPVLQLLCFSLSALNILGGKLWECNEKLARRFLEVDIRDQLEQRGVFEGSAGSGNYAMFLAILLLHAQNEQDNRNLRGGIWIESLLKSVNEFGFWSTKKAMSYLQFQNGYHQYEIFEFLGIASAPWEAAARSALGFMDELGHFAPYPGGGGCYDYDAIFLLTSKYTPDVGQRSGAPNIGNCMAEQTKMAGFVSQG